MIPALIAVAAVVPMIIEGIVSSRHDAALRSMGASEPPDDVLGWMLFAYPTTFATMVVEAWLRHVTPDAIFWWGVAVFVAAKALKYWAIGTLGVRWTFRVLVPPGSTPIHSGPYRFLRHPNYVAVIGELLGFALMAHAAVIGPIATFGFALLILRRIIVEERALGLQG